MTQGRWNIAKTAELYNISGWGEPYFSINRRGEVAVHPRGSKKRSISLKNLVDQIVERGIQTPFLLRFNDILLHRLNSIQKAFESAMHEYDYQGSYSIIYPIKVNQQRHVVDQISSYCMKNGHGLEGGSKPELLAVLAMSSNSHTPIVCNGYKDSEYFEIALMGRKVGKRIYPVIEKFSEFETLIQTAQKFKIVPEFGVRIKLSARSSGKWQGSSGHRSKFGLSFTELLRGIELLKKKGFIQGLKLLHFHQGSQITNINTVKKSLKEAARVYVEMIRAGVPLEILDVGGGMGVDYNGTRSNLDSSMNYSLQEYANDVVFQIKEVCDHAGVAHPSIFTECGRAIAAHHAILVFDILGVTGYDRARIKVRLNAKTPLPLRELRDVYKVLKKNSGNIVEHYHDAVANFNECQNLFELGYMTLQQRALAEELYFASLKCIHATLGEAEELSNDLKHLEDTLSDIYFGNFSLFQSLPDHWAVNHQFPIMPIHRLKEEPTRCAVIADISCDSDGKIDCFVRGGRSQNVLPLHAQHSREEYYVGVFLVGAYQETLGDLHNLFGDTNAVHVTLDASGKPVIETMVKGDTVKEVLSYVQYDVDDLIDMMQTQIERAVRKNLIDYKESGAFLKFYENAIEGYTYLEDWQKREEY